MATWSRKMWNKLHFWKNDPLRENFQNSFLKGFIGHRSMCCVQILWNLTTNFVKFDQREIGKVMRCLPDKKKQNYAPLSSSHYCRDRAQDLSPPSPDNVPKLLQISCKAVLFRRSYTWTGEHHQNVPFEVQWMAIMGGINPFISLGYAPDVVSPLHRLSDYSKVHCHN